MTAVKEVKQAMHDRYEISAATRQFLQQPRPMLIDGKWVESSSGETIRSLDPGTGQPIASVFRGGTQEVDAAVSAARRAFEQRHWRNMPCADRTLLMWRLAELIEQHRQILVELEVLDQGQPKALVDEFVIPGVCETLRYYAGWCTKITGVSNDISASDARQHRSIGPAYLAYSRMEPIGVVAAIVPWNFPLIMAVAKVAPAIAAGCTVVLKPAEETSLSALKLGELIMEAGFPAGVVNIVTGPGSQVGAALAAHPDVNKVTFTGSTPVGKQIVQAAVGNLKKVSLELGGKSPVIVFDDSDLDAAITGAAQSIFLNAGQVCFAGTRVYVQQSVFEDVADGVAEIARNIRLGHGLEKTSEMGPVVSARQQETVCSYIQSASEEGAEIRAGGNTTGAPGFFIEPTILTTSRPDIRVVREEIFGPVLSLVPFKTEEEVVALANDSQYGLAASIWTRDLSRAHSIAGAIQAGTVWINCHDLLDESMPFGGFKQSGWGTEGSHYGVEEYIQKKSVIATL